jgi:hypothetical protein
VGGGYTGKDPMDNIYVKTCILSSINGNTWGGRACPTVSNIAHYIGTRQKVRAMLKFILRRCLEAIPTLFILITISFFMMRLAPGSPFTGERTLPPEVMANIEAKYHLNDPI